MTAGPKPDDEAEETAVRQGKGQGRWTDDKQMMRSMTGECLFALVVDVTCCMLMLHSICMCGSQFHRVQIL